MAIEEYGFRDLGADHFNYCQRIRIRHACAVQDYEFIPTNPVAVGKLTSRFSENVCYGL